MSQPISPFRLLSKTYASHILTRDQYVMIRAQLLKKLQRQGKINEQDLSKLIDAVHGNGNKAPQVEKSYAASDWIIIVLGLVAAIILGLVLYG